MPEGHKILELQKSSEIANLRKQLLDADDAGDERACNFLATFGAWAQDELAKRRKS